MTVQHSSAAFTRSTGGGARLAGREPGRGFDGRLAASAGRQSAASQVLHAEGSAAVARLLSEQYGPMRLDPPDERQRVRMSRLTVGRSQLDRIALAGVGELTVDALTALHVGLLNEGLVAVGSGPRRRQYRPGEMLVALPGDGFVASVQDPHLDLTVLDPALILEVAAAQCGPTDSSVRPAPMGAGNRLWYRTFEHVRSTLLADPTVPDMPLLVGALERLLAAAALLAAPGVVAAALPQLALATATEFTGGDARPQTLRRAVAFIESSAETDIGVVDIARAAGVSVRAVQLSFRRHLDDTPLGHLRRIRLQRAHAELRDGHPTAGDTVSAIARRWGFINPGRFASAYRSVYGCSPVVTLRGHE